MEDYLVMKTKEEGIKIDKDAIDLVAKQATGALRDALSLLDLLASTGEKITLEKAQRILGISADRTVIELLSAVIEKDTQKALDAIHTSLGSGSDSRQFTRQVVDVLRQTLFIKTGNAEYVILSKEDKEILSGLAQKMEIPQLLYLIEVFNQTAEEKQITWQPSLALEIAIIKAITPPALQPIATPSGVSVGNAHSMASASASKAQPVKKKATKSTNTTPVKKELPQWNELLAEARKLNKNLEALLKTSSKRFAENDTLWLGYSSNMIIKKFDEGTNLKDLKEAIKTVFGKEYQINCFETSLTEELPAGIKQDSLVANAIRLGGEIVSENDLN
jgi:DNA polymerase-3 subunit gamma/tau